MAGELAQFFVRLGTIFDDKGIKEATGSIRGMESRVDALTGLLGGLGVALSTGAVIKFGVDALRSFAESERGANQFAGAMRNLGVYTREALAENLAFAASMQRATVYSDEEVVGVMKLLTTYGMYGKALRETTQDVLDLATRKDLDLHTATMTLGKAFDGEVGRLKLLGIHFTDTGSKAANFAQITSEVRRIAGGAAAEEMGTYAGKVKNLGNAWDEVKESIGQLLVGPAMGVINWLKDAVVVSDFLVQKWRQLFPVDPVEKAQKRLAEVNKELAQISGRTKDFGLMSTLIGDDNQQLARQKVLLAEKVALLKQIKAAAAPDAPAPGAKPGAGKTDLSEVGLAREKANLEKSITADELLWDAELRKQYADDALLGMKDQTRSEADIARNAAAQREVQEAADFSTRLNMAAAFETDKTRKAKLEAAARDTFKKKSDEVEAKLDKERFKAMIAGAAGALSFIAGAWGEHTAMYKASSIALATINTYQAYTAALTVPVIGPLLAAAVLASGMAMVAKIAGVKLAAGALVRGRSGGTNATVGEAGDEAVLPLSNWSAMRDIGRAIVGAGGISLAGAGGGSIQVNQTFNFSGGSGEEAGGVTAIMDGIRTATRDGVTEAIDLAKQLYNTGASEATRA